MLKLCNIGYIYIIMLSVKLLSCTKAKSLAVEKQL